LYKQYQEGVTAKVNAVFNRYNLSNGAVVLTEHLPYMRSVAVGLWIGYGSRTEVSAGDFGSAHMIEHMLFKGTMDKDPKELAISFESVGASFNAAASRETTYLYSRVMGERLPLALYNLSDMALRSVFPPHEFERERGVVLEEIKAHEDMPEEISYDLFLQDYFGGHGLAHSILGTEEGAEGMTRDRLFELYRKAYRPAHLVVAVAGNLLGHDVPALAEGALGEDSAPPCRFLSKEPPPAEPARSVNIIGRDTYQAQVYAGFPGVAYDYDDFYAFSTLDMILSGGMSSRLFHEVREKRGLVYEISTDNVSYSDAGVFYVYAGVRIENLLEVLRITVQELDKVRNGETGSDELQRVKEQFRAGTVMSHESVVARMSRLARNELYFGRYMSDGEILERLEAVTLEDITRVARDSFRRKNLVFTAMGPFAENEAERWKSEISEILDIL